VVLLRQALQYACALAIVLKNEPTNDVKQLSDKIGNDVSKLVMNEAAAGEELYKILNSEQQNELTQLQKQNCGRLAMGWSVNG
jgi:hypothetical protein